MIASPDSDRIFAPICAIGSHYYVMSMTKQTMPKRGITPPKGKPTRARSAMPTDKRVFGPVAQWIAFSVLLILAFVVLVILTNGGDFNPLNQNSQVGTIAASIVPGLTGMI